MIPVNAGEGRGRPKPDVVDRPRPTVISVLDRERNGGSFCGAEASLLTLLFSPTVVSLGWETLFPGIAAVRPGAAGEAGRKLSFAQLAGDSPSGHSSGERQRSVRRLPLIACPAGVSAIEHRTGLGWRQGRNVGKQSCPFEHFGIRVRFTRRPYRPATGKILQRRKTKSKVSWPLRRLTSTSLSFSASFQAIRPIAGRTFRVRRRSHNSDVSTTTRRRDSEEAPGLCLLHQ